MTSSLRCQLRFMFLWTPLTGLVGVLSYCLFSMYVIMPWSRNIWFQMTEMQTILTSTKKKVHWFIHWKCPIIDLGACRWQGLQAQFSAVLLTVPSSLSGLLSGWLIETTWLKLSQNSHVLSRLSGGSNLSWWLPKEKGETFLPLKFHQKSPIVSLIEIVTHALLKQSLQSWKRDNTLTGSS